MIFAAVKLTQKQQEIKLLVTVSKKFFVRSVVLSKLELKYKTGIYFSFNFDWYFIQLNILTNNMVVEKGGGGRGGTL